MPFIEAAADAEALTLTTICEFAAPPEQVWQAWADPRKLERWWGPPGYPTVFTRHDFVVPGGTTFVMTLPGGEEFTLYWHYRVIEPMSRIVAVDGRSEAEGGGTDGLPGAADMEITFTPIETGTRMQVVQRFGTAEGLEQQLTMATDEETRVYWGRIDDLVAAG